MATGIQCRVKELAERDYMALIIAVDDGRYLWSKQSGIRRLSRTDAMRDAHAMAHDCIISRFETSILSV